MNKYDHLYKVCVRCNEPSEEEMCEDCVEEFSSMDLEDQFDELFKAGEESKP